jgi:tRNA(Ile)-lysidine synthase
VSDLLIDAKIPLHEKENVWVLESNNEICWVVGIRSSEKFKVTDKTKRVYLVELS